MKMGREAVARVRDHFDRFWSKALESFRNAVETKKEKKL